MGLEFRRDRAYFYRKRRRDGRVVSEYVGGGVLCLIVAEREEAERADRAEAAAAWRAERERMEEEERAAAEYFARVEAQARAMLTAAGYHRPKRQWRKRRVDVNATTTPADGPGGPPGETRAELEGAGMALLRRAIDGDEASRAVIVRIMERPADHPDLSRKIVDQFGDLRRYAAHALISELSGGSPITGGSPRRTGATCRRFGRWRRSGS